MTNDIVKIKSVAASQGGETEHGLMLDSSILSYTYQGSSKTVKWILDTIFTLLGGKAASSTTLAGYGITDAYTKTQVDTALATKLSSAITDMYVNPNGYTAAINQMNSENLYLLLNVEIGQGSGTNKQLSNILTVTGSTNRICFHLNSGSLVKDFYLIRKFTFTKNSITYNFVEVVGAWDAN